MPPRRRILVTGVVQGVGFRPYVYNLARERKLCGFVYNHSAGVTIEVEGQPEALLRFSDELISGLPPLAVIEGLTSEEIKPVGDTAFVILASESTLAASTPVPADIATCLECLRELNNPADRRFGYPFINCTNCGPRFTIIRDLPYDRPATSMAKFAMCPECAAEYHDPADRRFHAQPNACPACGPALSMDVNEVRVKLAAGLILAVKGIGGFHLVCNATDDQALTRLRERKGRFDQPFAVMARDLDMVRQIAECGVEEERLLSSRQRPIVLLTKRFTGVLSDLVAPGNRYVGVMLPYSPVHHLLVGEKPLVMTSANPSGEPIVRENSEAIERLTDIADAFLTHNRDIEVVCDDSVVRTFEGRELPLRRSRGYAPLPIRWPGGEGSILAVGAELKSTFCLTKDRFAYVSQHIGDAGALATQVAFERALDHMLRLFRVEPKAIACDLHPGYQSVAWAERFARQREVPLIKVQHHHAHVASLLADSELPRETPIIGIAFDGTGFGTDGAIWGGEVLLVNGPQFERFAHLRYVSLAGGDATVKMPARTALSYLRAAGIAWDKDLACVACFSSTELRVLDRQLEREINCVPSSSMGRLFDAVSALLGIRQRVTYEGQAAIELESLAARGNARDYPSPIITGQPAILDYAPLLSAIVVDQRKGIPREDIAAGFHNAVASWIRDVSRVSRDKTGLNLVGLTGGVFQNLTLLHRTVTLLRQDGFQPLVHHAVPPNDGGICLGQAAIAQGLRNARG